MDEWMNELMDDNIAFLIPIREAASSRTSRQR
jgi:hypothetical protein